MASRAMKSITPTEQVVLDHIERAAISQTELTSNDEIAHELNFTGTGTVRGIMLRLQEKGYIEIRSFQRGRQVKHIPTGLWTKAPNCITEHWRTKDGWRETYEKSKTVTPALPEHTLRQAPTVMVVVNQIMREQNLSFPQAQIMLMSIGCEALGSEG